MATSTPSIQSQMYAAGGTNFAPTASSAGSPGSLIPNSPTTPLFNANGQNINQPSGPNASTYFSTPQNPFANATSKAANSMLPQTPTSYPVVTSNPATANYNAIQQDYNQSIAPKVNAAAQAQAQAKTQAANLPVMDGYAVSPTKTGKPGETTLQSNGQTYYATPNEPPVTANDLKGILDPTTAANFAQANPGLTPNAQDTAIGNGTPAGLAMNSTGIDPNQVNSDYQNSLNSSQNDLTDAYNTYQKAIQSMQSGAFPLTPAQQSLVDATNQAFNQMTTQANLKAGALSSETGGVSNKINATAGELLNINSAQAAAVSKLEIAFQTADYQLATDQYKAFQDYNTQKMSILKDAHDTVMSTYNSALTAAQTERTYQMDVQKFQQTKDQNAFDNAFKVEQEKFAENKDKAAAAETSRHNKATEAIDSFKAGMGAGGSSTVGSGIMGTQMSPTGGVDPVSQKQTYDQIAQTYGPMTAVAIQGLVDYSRLPSDWKPGASKGMTRDQAVTLAQMLDPTYTEAGAPARQAYMKGLAETSQSSIGGQINAANTGIAHLANYVDTMSKIPKTASSKLNWFDNMVTLNQGVRQNLAQAKTEGEGVGTEFAKFLSSSAPDVASLNEQKSNLGVNASDADVKGATQGMLNLLSGRLQTLSDQYQQVMGHPMSSTFLNPQSIQKLSNLKNQGYKVDIPGVNYTDKAAWQKNGGTQEAWNSSVDALTKAGVPLTPENILQYAQEQ